jgi:UPF0755 protein
MSVDASAEPLPEEAPRKRHQRKRRRKVTWILGATALILVVIASYYEIESNALLASSSGTAIVTVSGGESASSVFGAMASEGIIGSASMMRLYTLLHGTPTILQGSYQIHRGTSFSQAFKALSAGPNVIPIDVPAGFTFKEIVNRVGAYGANRVADEMARAASSGAVRSAFEPPSVNDLEGLVAPGRYLITPASTGAQVLRSMVHRFSVLAAAHGLTPTTTSNGLDAYHLVIASSIVEKEGYYNVNMPKVARVIYNRLAKGMALQMDSTILYALGRDGGRVTTGDLAVRSPYNTYLNTGLPPTPTCMSSGAAMNAVMHAPSGSWLYFVLINKAGVEAFSNTYAQQLANEAIARAAGL